MNRWPDSRTEVLSRRQALAFFGAAGVAIVAAACSDGSGDGAVRLGGFLPLGIHGPRVEHRSERDGEQRRRLRARTGKPAPSTAC